eukprot:scaffold21095_cov92-Amphora_coffeaeformis.AAC.2
MDEPRSCLGMRNVGFMHFSPLSLFENGREMNEDFRVAFDYIKTCSFSLAQHVPSHFKRESLGYAACHGSKQQVDSHMEGNGGLARAKPESSVSDTCVHLYRVPDGVSLCRYFNHLGGCINATGSSRTFGVSNLYRVVYICIFRFTAVAQEEECGKIGHGHVRRVFCR